MNLVKLQRDPFAAKSQLAESRAALLGSLGYEVDRAGVEGIEHVVLVRKQLDGSAAKGHRVALGRSTHSTGAPHQRPLLLAGYAKAHPAKIMAYGAGAGVLLYILRPWRLLSAATLAAIVVKYSKVPTAIAGVFDRPRKRSHRDR